jgi:putative transposase
MTRSATVNDGSQVDALSALKRPVHTPRKIRRRVSRKTEFGIRKKPKARVQKIHTGIANDRNDFLHKTSATIS